MLKNLSVIVPAAGLGNRFGMPKVRAKLFDRYFPEIISDLYDNVQDKYLVVNEFDYDFAKMQFPNYRILINDKLDLGMIYSIQIALKNIDTEWIAVHPVDYIFVRKDVIKLAMDKLDNIYDVIKLSYKHKVGHPIFINKRLKNEILSCKSNLNDVISNIKNYLIVDVDSDTILTNINEKSELNDAIKRYHNKNI